ncbi:MAG: hypothetical protein HY081_03675 [Gammaproteobacteria bacterium]|nr:hypothetical protein [Gammaproteobacteria bacterium]
MNTPKIKNLRFKQSSLFVSLMVVAAISQASIVSFSLDQSNRLPDGIDYVSVKLTENSNGGVDVVAKTLDSLDTFKGCHFGIQKLAFNFDDGTMANISGLPDGWKVKSDRGMNGFGKFDTGILGLSDARTDNLSFTVNGVGIDDFESFFAVKVGGLDLPSGKHGSAFFGGSLENGIVSDNSGGGDGNLAPVPLPPAAWLLGSGLVGLIGVTRRRSKQ